jgi:hypothetical protein
VVTFPVSDRPTEHGVFEIWTRFDVADAFAGMSPEARSVRLELRFTSRNFTWAKDLHRRPAERPPLEVSFGGPGDTVTLSRG